MVAALIRSAYAVAAPPARNGVPWPVACISPHPATGRDLSRSHRTDVIIIASGVRPQRRCLVGSDNPSRNAAISARVHE